MNLKKEEYVAEHPEHRKLVFRARKARTDKEGEGEGDKEPQVDRTRKLFDKNGIPIHPERSIYYDPVMNPFGVPPPGMPYIERRAYMIYLTAAINSELLSVFDSALRPEEMEQAQEEEGTIEFAPSFILQH